MFILFLTIVIGSNVATTTTELDDAQACKIAAAYIRADIAKSYEKSSWAPRVITSCAPKSSPSPVNTNTQGNASSIQYSRVTGH